MRRLRKRGMPSVKVASVVNSKTWTELKRDKQAFGIQKPGIKPGRMSEEEYMSLVHSLPKRPFAY